MNKILFLAFMILISVLSAESFAIVDEKIPSRELIGGQYRGIVRVVQHGNVLYEKCWGEADAHSQFCVASLSKSVTAALILRMTDDPKGKEVLPGANVTMHTVLNHTALSRGKKFQYSNEGYNFLGKAIEGHYGKTYEAVAQELFASLELHDSFFPGADHRFAEQTVIQGYNEGNDGSFSMVQDFPKAKDMASTGLVSSAFDLELWIRSLNQGKVLSDKAYSAMITPSSTLSHRFSETLGYGYGLQIFVSEGLLEIGHCGWTPGYMSSLYYYPDHDLSIVFLENVSWQIDDPAQCFCDHDVVRDAVRHYLTQPPIEECLE